MNWSAGTSRATAAKASLVPKMPDPGATAISKHSLTIAGHRTSISLEQAFWDKLRDIAGARGLSLAALIGEIDAGRGAANLSSAIRVFVLAQALGSVAAGGTRIGRHEPRRIGRRCRGRRWRRLGRWRDRERLRLCRLFRRLLLFRRQQ